MLSTTITSKRRSSHFDVGPVAYTRCALSLYISLIDLLPITSMTSKNSLHVGRSYERRVY